MTTKPERASFEQAKPAWWHGAWRVGGCVALAVTGYGPLKKLDIAAGELQWDV